MAHHNLLLPLNCVLVPIIQLTPFFSLSSPSLDLVTTFTSSLPLVVQRTKPKVLSLLSNHFTYL